MKIHHFNLSDFHPRYITEQEVNDPLMVIRDFFSVDWLTGHLDSLKRWRKYVIEDAYYKDKSSGPVSLLFTHKLTMSLIEALYILNLSRSAKQSLVKIRLNVNAQLQLEQLSWIDYPVYLSEEEVINPYLAIAHFFKAYTVGQYGELLREWLETALSTSAADETLEASDIIYVYENLQKLYEAAWVIRQREIESPILKRFEIEEPNLAIDQMRSELSLVHLNCAFNGTLTVTEKLGLDELVKIIRNRVPSVQMIIHLGTHSKPEAYYLLVVTDEKDKSFEHDIIHTIEAICKPLIDVCVIVHKSDAFIRGISEGGRFFCNALAKCEIAYRSAELALPKLPSVDKGLVQMQNEAIWKRWGKQGKDFLDTALHSYDEGNYGLSLFLMHQAVESALSAIIWINLGYRLSIHNLERMLRLTLMFTDDLRGIFEIGPGKDAGLFDLLQSSYTSARYKDDFNADSEMVKALSDMVCKLFITAEGFYTQAMDKLRE
ncbi:HEPN domain-containing protein [Mucilaginibacter roseus]|uniref:HEPN domain-containing protein n=1 Tax=Mucilaginibacter roseus TaxID=1528868 RepID=A0ABS8TXU2_9SPHI|nr:HEPN domain-containing protein [Mucilaginibacter roseus]MCD8739690.1 HEPN domain-containing protein [Mucilaginibacter roseus]